MNKNIKDIIFERRTIHNYNQNIVSDEIINESIDCFLQAPNHRHTQPWKIKIANRPQRERLAEDAVEMKKTKKELSETQIKAIKAKYTCPSHLLVILQIKSDSEFQSKEDYAAISCGLMNMSLYLWDKNVGTKWSTGGITRSEKTYQLLDVDENVYEIVGFMWAGHYDHTPKKPAKLAAEDVII